MTRTGDVLRVVDEEARHLAKALVRAARHAALASLLPESGAPLASRVLVATDEAGRPLLLVSRLAAHTGALFGEPRCSLLFGEPGTGDPLRWPRLSLFGHAHEIGEAERDGMRRRFLARHPGAALYCDFADFHWLRVEPSAASLNAGFARAYELSPEDLLDPVDEALAARLDRAVAHMNEDHADTVDAIAAAHGGLDGTGWRIVTADASGFEIAREDRLARIAFAQPIRQAEEIRPAFVGLARASA
ncbi:pyridoxamine 5'-phosphate oxidase-like FMN-binding protein [Aureimonas endophytica]|uniref:Pyridoxamine 5'-phosphate oxidase-like FMN-binding protein n=1 Tax=Aureimonas endophytica TaxID=2027858 RepID=A0A916ZYS4_9HYPH|nr:DUF2470 domain-containing protein [Aureimonas endophytica]GGE19555.1 pyridoxamine 5'-phosphate oxidase-like FMN-binding protein [Aureimonas endophytica]